MDQCEITFFAFIIIKSIEIIDITIKTIFNQ